MFSSGQADTDEITHGYGNTTKYPATNEGYLYQHDLTSEVYGTLHPSRSESLRQPKQASTMHVLYAWGVYIYLDKYQKKTCNTGRINQPTNLGTRRTNLGLLGQKERAGGALPSGAGRQC